MRRFDGMLSVEEYLKRELMVESTLEEVLRLQGVDPAETSVGEAFRLRAEMMLSPQLNGAISYCPFRRHRLRQDRNRWY